jgi:hypothetical protein
VGAKDLSKAHFDLDPKTEKVLSKDNPDETRKDMQQEYDMKDDFGSGMNVALDKMNKKEAQDVSVEFSRDGIDGNLSDI